LGVNTYIATIYVEKLQKIQKTKKKEKSKKTKKKEKNPKKKNKYNLLLSSIFSLLCNKKIESISFNYLIIYL
jgi:hypothetical protein